jgi:hypothetical protein
MCYLGARLALGAFTDMAGVPQLCATLDNILFWWVILQHALAFVHVY